MLHKIRYIIDGLRIFIPANHFLETGDIGLVLIDKVQHLLFFFGMCFVFQYIKMFYIPGHHPYVGRVFYHRKIYRPS